MQPRFLEKVSVLIVYQMLVIFHYYFPQQFVKFMFGVNLCLLA